MEARPEDNFLRAFSVLNGAKGAGGPTTGPYTGEDVGLHFSPTGGPFRHYTFVQSPRGKGPKGKPLAVSHRRGGGGGTLHGEKNNRGPETFVQTSAAPPWSFFYFTLLGDGQNSLLYSFAESTLLTRHPGSIG